MIVFSLFFSLKKFPNPAAKVIQCHIHLYLLCEGPIKIVCSTSGPDSIFSVICQKKMAFDRPKQIFVSVFTPLPCCVVCTTYFFLLCGYSRILSQASPLPKIFETITHRHERKSWLSNFYEKDKKVIGTMPTSKVLWKVNSDGTKNSNVYT